MATTEGIPETESKPPETESNLPEAESETPETEPEVAPNPLDNPRCFFDISVGGDKGELAREEMKVDELGRWTNLPPLTFVCKCSNVPETERHTSSIPKPKVTIFAQQIAASLSFKITPGL